MGTHIHTEYIAVGECDEAGGDDIPWVAPAAVALTVSLPPHLSYFRSSVCRCSHPLSRCSLSCALAPARWQVAAGGHVPRSHQVRRVWGRAAHDDVAAPVVDATVTAKIL